MNAWKSRLTAKKRQKHGEVKRPSERNYSRDICQQFKSSVLDWRASSDQQSNESHNNTASANIQTQEDIKSGSQSGPPIFDINRDLHSDQPFFDIKSDSHLDQPVFDSRSDSQSGQPVFDINRDSQHSQSVFDGSSQSGQADYPKSDSQSGQPAFDSRSDSQSGQPVFDINRDSQHSQSVFDGSSQSGQADYPKSDSQSGQPVFDINRDSQDGQSVFDGSSQSGQADYPKSSQSGQPVFDSRSDLQSGQPAYDIRSDSQSGQPFFASEATHNHCDIVREKILAIYRIHNPPKVPELDKIMKKYAGKELDLLHMIESKYSSSPWPFSPSNPKSAGTRVYFDVSIQGGTPERITMRLNCAQFPITCENFRQISIGVKVYCRICYCHIL
jgi:hypothetical protein